MEDQYETRQINDILEACMTTVEQETPARWKFELRNGIEVGGLAHCDDGWLGLMTSPVATDPAGQSDGALHLLTLNGVLPGGTKFCWLRDGMMLGVLGELPLARDVDLARRVREVCQGLVVATRAYALVFDPCTVRPEPADLGSVCNRLIVNEAAADEDVEPWTTAAMLQLCNEAGWEGSERGADRVVVELDVPGGFRQAVLSGMTRAGGLRVETGLEPCLATAALACRRALGTLLLRTCGIVRMVRAVVDVAAEHIVPRFEVCFDGAPRPAEVASALAALSTACRLSADEAEVLQRDQRLAHIYMAPLGVFTTPAPETAGGRDRRQKRRRATRINATTSRRSIRAEGSRTS